MNTIIIKGRLVRDPEMRHTDSGKSVTNFSVAVNRRFQKDKADFFNVTAWEKTGEFVDKYFHKGQEIAVQGEMQSREYTDRDGNKRTAWDVIASNVEFCGSKSDSEGNSGGSYQPVTHAPDIPPDAPQYAKGDTGDFEQMPIDDDLPF
ncbi:single-stranded DNA-binding protein [Clostridium sp. KNHs216]|uniref:single-stranded DNA-binding protein n=1 Tax=Clostridium sp. KNHs216 TaxID=1550235 RepID=UPI001170C3DA|nr:single-stranded DNA-binding protein [Clostridium sp. KNHs216]TQI68976.1 single-strand DNA-binding protein [Clostridium sp. KNHs216]